MKNRVFLAFSAADYLRANVIWKALAIPGLTRWMSTRDPLDDEKPEPQDMEELSRSSALVLILSHRAVQGERLTQELKLARRRGLPILVVLIGAEAKCRQEWGDLVANAAMIRVGVLQAAETAQVVEHIKSLLNSIPVSDTRSSTASVPSPRVPSPRIPTAAIPSPTVPNGQRQVVAASAIHTDEVRDTEKKPILSNSEPTQSVDPLERAMTPVEGEEQDDPAYASRRLSMDHPVEPAKPVVRLWPPNSRTVLIGCGVLAAMVAGAGLFLANSIASQTSNMTTPSIGIPHVVRPLVAATPAIVNPPPATGSTPATTQTPLQTSDQGNASASTNSKPVQVERVLRPSSVLTPDQLGGLTNIPDATTPQQGTAPPAGARFRDAPGQDRQAGAISGPSPNLDDPTWPSHPRRCTLIV